VNGHGGTTGPEPIGRIPPYLRVAPTAPNPQPDGGDQIRQRPFILTSGRVDAVDREIDLETQVTLRPLEPGEVRVPYASLSPEMQAMLTLCADPVSVAEISARLRLHLGVTKILVADLRAAGFLDVHLIDALDQHSVETIMRVMRGLRAIT
jgi:hypothetical protein